MFLLIVSKISYHYWLFVYVPSTYSSTSEEKRSCFSVFVSVFCVSFGIFLNLCLPFTQSLCALSIRRYFTWNERTFPDPEVILFVCTCGLCHHLVNCCDLDSPSSDHGIFYYLQMSGDAGVLMETRKKDGCYSRPSYCCKLLHERD